MLVSCQVSDWYHTPGMRTACAMAWCVKNSLMCGWNQKWSVWPEYRVQGGQGERNTRWLGSIFEKHHKKVFWRILGRGNNITLAHCKDDMAILWRTDLGWAWSGCKESSYWYSPGERQWLGPGEWQWQWIVGDGIGSTSKWIGYWGLGRGRWKEWLLDFGLYPWMEGYRCHLLRYCTLEDN